MSQVEVKSSDVIKLILQFLQENNLQRSFQTLQEESAVSLNLVDTNRFISGIMDGRWDQVLSQLSAAVLSEEQWC